MSTILRHPSRPPPPLLSQRRRYSYSAFHVLPIRSPSQKIVVFCSSSSLREPFSILAEEPSPPSEVTESPELDFPDGIEKNPNFRSPSQKIVVFCSSSSLREPFSILAEEPSPPSEVTESPELDFPDGIEKNPNFRGCKTCGRDEIERGCNGEGRIQGGIATVPGFRWWPIKAFRPCPGFVASGGRYRRQGQSMDEVAFGRTERDISVKFSDKAKSSKKNRGQR